MGKKPPSSAAGCSDADTTRKNRRLSSTELFGASRRVEIEHGGEVYQLQITRHGKLILTK